MPAGNELSPKVTWNHFYLLPQCRLLQRVLRSLSFLFSDEFVLSRTEAHEIVAAIFATVTPATYFHLKQHGSRAAVVFGVPGTEVHSIAFWALRPEHRADSPDLSREPFVAFPAAELEESKHLSHALSNGAGE